MQQEHQRLLSHQRRAREALQDELHNLGTEDSHLQRITQELESESETRLAESELAWRARVASARVVMEEQVVSDEGRVDEVRNRCETLAREIDILEDTVSRETATATELHNEALQGRAVYDELVPPMEAELVELEGDEAMEAAALRSEVSSAVAVAAEEGGAREAMAARTTEAAALQAATGELATAEAKQRAAIEALRRANEEVYGSAAKVQMASDALAAQVRFERNLGEEARAAAASAAEAQAYTASIHQSHRDASALELRQLICQLDALREAKDEHTRALANTAYEAQLAQISEIKVQIEATIKEETRWQAETEAAHEALNSPEAAHVCAQLEKDRLEANVLRRGIDELRQKSFDFEEAERAAAHAEAEELTQLEDLAAQAREGTDQFATQVRALRDSHTNEEFAIAGPAEAAFQAEQEAAHQLGHSRGELAVAEAHLRQVERSSEMSLSAEDARAVEIIARHEAAPGHFARELEALLSDMSVCAGEHGVVFPGAADGCGDAASRAIPSLEEGFASSRSVSEPAVTSDRLLAAAERTHATLFIQMSPSGEPPYAVDLVDAAALEAYGPPEAAGESPEALSEVPQAANRVNAMFFKVAQAFDEPPKAADGVEATLAVTTEDFATKLLSLCDTLHTGCHTMAAEAQERYEAEVCAAAASESASLQQRHECEMEITSLRAELEERRFAGLGRHLLHTHELAAERNQLAAGAQGERVSLAAEASSVQAATAEYERCLLACAAAWRTEYAAAVDHLHVTNRDLQEDHQEWRTSLLHEIADSEADNMAAVALSRQADAYEAQLEHDAYENFMAFQNCIDAQARNQLDPDAIDNGSGGGDSRRWEPRIFDLERQIEAVILESEEHALMRDAADREAEGVACAEWEHQKTLMEEIADMASMFRSLQLKHGDAMKALRKIQMSMTTGRGQDARAALEDDVDAAPGGFLGLLDGAASSDSDCSM